jgi:hypothetical protein
MTAPVPATAAAEVPFQLTPPEVVQPVAPQVARGAVPLSAAAQAAVEDQVERFIAALLSEDLQSDSFRAKLDSAFALGREEVSVAASLMQGRFMERNFIGMEDSAAFKAVREMRGYLDDLNPGKEGDLFQPNKLLGLIPWGNRLRNYFRKYQEVGGSLRRPCSSCMAPATTCNAMWWKSTPPAPSCGTACRSWPGPSSLRKSSTPSCLPRSSR